MTTKIIRADVIGRSQNRTALGMMTAYLAMYPKTSLAELKATFPRREVCPDAGIEDIFYTQSEIEQGESDWFKNGNACFTESYEWLVLHDGQKVGFGKMWTASSLVLLQKRMAQFNIYGEVGKVSRDHRAGYIIAYQKEQRKGVPIWVWILLGLILAIGGYFAYASMKSEPAPQTDTTAQPAVQTQTQAVAQEIETQITKQFNAAKFEKGKAQLNDESRAALMDLVQLMQQNPSISLKVEGHASAEGDEAFNKQIAADRAKTVIDFLITQGIDSSRLSYQSFGSERLKNTDNPSADENRRTEFIVNQ